LVEEKERLPVPIEKRVVDGGMREVVIVDNSTPFPSIVKLSGPISTVSVSLFRFAAHSLITDTPKGWNESDCFSVRQGRSSLTPQFMGLSLASVTPTQTSFIFGSHSSFHPVGSTFILCGADEVEKEERNGLREPIFDAVSLIVTS
jgi:hypothetical protein